MLIYDNKGFYIVVSKQGGFDVEAEDGTVIASFQYEHQAREYVNKEIKNV